MSSDHRTFQVLEFSIPLQGTSILVGCHNNLETSTQHNHHIFFRALDKCGWNILKTSSELSDETLCRRHTILRIGLTIKSGRHDKSYFSDWSISIARHTKCWVVDIFFRKLDTAFRLYASYLSKKSSAKWIVFDISIGHTCHRKIGYTCHAFNFSFQFFIWKTEFYLKSLNYTIPWPSTIFTTKYTTFFATEKSIMIYEGRSIIMSLIRLHKIHGLIDLLFPFHAWFG